MIRTAQRMKRMASSILLTLFVTSSCSASIDSNDLRSNDTASSPYDYIYQTLESLAQRNTFEGTLDRTDIETSIQTYPGDVVPILIDAIDSALARPESVRNQELYIETLLWTLRSFRDERTLGVLEKCLYVESHYIQGSAYDCMAQLTTSMELLPVLIRALDHPERQFDSARVGLFGALDMLLIFTKCDVAKKRQLSVYEYLGESDKVDRTMVEKDVAAFKAWYAENQGYIYPGQDVRNDQTGKWSTLEFIYPEQDFGHPSYRVAPTAKREGLRANLWLLIPKDKRSVWDILAEEQKKNIVEQARRALEKIDTLKSEAREVNVHINMWRRMDEATRKSWTSLSEWDKFVIIQNDETPASQARRNVNRQLYERLRDIAVQLQTN